MSCEAVYAWDRRSRRRRVSMSTKNIIIAATSDFDDVESPLTCHTTYTIPTAPRMPQGRQGGRGWLGAQEAGTWYNVGVVWASKSLFSSHPQPPVSCRTRLLAVFLNPYSHAFARTHIVYRKRKCRSTIPVLRTPNL